MSIRCDTGKRPDERFTQLLDYKNMVLVLLDVGKREIYLKWEIIYYIQKQNHYIGKLGNHRLQ